MVDIAPSAIRPEPVWRSLGRNLAVAAGALSALLSLLVGTTVSTACTRGAVALFGVLLLTRLGTAALAGIEASEQRILEEAAAREESADAHEEHLDESTTRDSQRTTQKAGGGAR